MLQAATTLNQCMKQPTTLIHAASPPQLDTGFTTAATATAQLLS
jgi:hypothetical protein